MYFKGYGGENLILILLVIVWSLFWKGYALWTSAHRREKIWFVAILVVNTAGILELIYLFGFAKKKWSDITALFKRHTTALGGSLGQTQR